VIVRAVEPADLAPAAEVWYHAWRDAHLAIVPPALSAARTQASFLERLTAAREQTRVIGPIGAPLGFCVVDKDELYQLFVAAAARGTGAAAALLADGEARLAAAGVTTAWLSCAVGNLRAARFYEKHGWVRSETFVSPLGVVDLDCWRYEKRVGALTSPLAT
jgi:ribosomal protein S18 acetylase RimI-like enzyme